MQKYEYTPYKYKKDRELVVVYSGFVPRQKGTNNQPGEPAHVDIDDFKINLLPVGHNIYEDLMYAIGESVHTEIIQKIEAGEIPG